jgi:hypothetical protein
LRIVRERKFGAEKDVGTWTLIATLAAEIASIVGKIERRQASLHRDD